MYSSRVTDALASHLGQAQQAYNSLPHMISLIGHCLYCASLEEKLRGHFLVHFISTFLTAFGGGLFSSLLFSDRDKLPISILSNEAMGWTWVAIWWSVNWAPLSLVTTAVSWAPFKSLTKATVIYNRARQMCYRMQALSDRHPGHVIGPILFGTFGASIGKISTDTIRMIADPNEPNPRHEALSPTYTFRSALLCSIIYVLSAVCPLTRFLSSSEGTSLITTILIGQGLLSDMTGMPMDWTLPICNLFTSLLCVKREIGSKLVEKSTKKSDDKKPKATQAPPPPRDKDATAAIKATAPASVSAGAQAYERNDAISDQPLSLNHTSDAIWSCMTIDEPKIKEPAAGPNVSQKVNQSHVRPSKSKVKPVESSSGWTRVGKK